MPNNEDYQARIDDLFSQTEPPPQPVEGDLPLDEAPPAPQPAEDDLPLGAPPAPQPAEDDLPLDEAPSTPKAAPSSTAPFGGTAPTGGTYFIGGDAIGWKDYLDAINRPEHIGFVFDQSEVKPVGAPDDAPPPEGEVLEVPLQVGGAVLGALQVEGEGWSDAEQHLLAAIAQQVTQHIENLRLLEQAKQYRAEVAQATHQVTHDGWANYLQTDDLPVRGFLYDRNRVQPWDVDDIEVFTDFASALDLYAEPLQVRNEPIGQIMVADPQRSPEIAADLLTAVAARLSTHIENLRLLYETERARQQLDKRAAELETVARVSTAAASILDPQSLLQSVVDLTRYSFNLYHSSVYLLNETGSLLELTAASGKIGHAMIKEGHSIHLYQEQSIIARAARTRETVIVHDVRDEPGFLHHHLLPDAASEVAIPLVVGEQLIGVLDMESDEVGRFSEEDTLIFNTLAAQTAVALRNAQLYAEQMETVERLRELDHLKSAFLANMSHELRTPLNSILGFTQVILEGLDGPLTEDMQMDLQLIEKNGKHLLTLINEILDMAKIESGRVTLSLEPVNLPEMLNDVVRTTRPLLRKGVAFDVHSQLPEKMYIMADAIRLRQVLINMVGNALKFTERGSVRVEAEQVEDRVRICVRDTGVGIPPDKLESIFEAFSQVDTSTTRKVGGTGLGLPISRRLAEMHGGWLWAESSGVPGEGSAFYVELPIGNPEEM